MIREGEDELLATDAAILEVRNELKYVGEMKNLMKGYVDGQKEFALTMLNNTISAASLSSSIYRPSTDALHGWIKKWAASRIRIHKECEKTVIVPMTELLKENEDKLSATCSEYNRVRAEAGKLDQLVEIDRSECLHLWMKLQEVWVGIEVQSGLELSKAQSDKLFDTIAKDGGIDNLLSTYKQSAISLSLSGKKKPDEATQFSEVLIISKKMKKLLKKVVECRDEVITRFRRHLLLVDRGNSFLSAMFDEKFPNLFKEIHVQIALSSQSVCSFVANFVGLLDGDESGKTIKDTLEAMHPVNYELKGMKKRRDYERIPWLLPCHAKHLMSLDEDVRALLKLDAHAVVENIGHRRLEWVREVLLEQNASKFVVCVEALENVEAESDDCISFKKGDVIRITENIDNEYAKGHVVSVIPCGRSGILALSTVKTLLYDENMDFSHVLQIPYGIRLFRLHLIKENNEMELDFLLEVDSLMFKVAEYYATIFSPDQVISRIPSVRGKIRHAVFEDTRPQSVFLDDFDDEFPSLKPKSIDQLHIPAELRADALALIARYIVDGSSKQINLSWECSSRILLQRDSTEEMSVDVFVDACRDTYLLLKRDSFYRFKRSEMFQDFLTQMMDILPELPDPQIARPPSISRLSLSLPPELMPASFDSALHPLHTEPSFQHTFKIDGLVRGFTVSPTWASHPNSPGPSPREFIPPNMELKPKP